MASFRSRAQLAALLLFAPISMPLSAETQAAAELPDRNSFHEKMLSWSAEAESQQKLPGRVVQKAGSATGFLPRLSSRFGHRNDPFGGRARLHAGIDIPGAHGTPVSASAGGIVSFAGTAGGYGNMVEIDHGGGLRTRYAHLSRILVTGNSPVARGQTIALMGSTGRSTGSHLHFEVRRHGRAADPLAYMGGSAPDITSYTIWNAKVEPHISQFARARAATRM